MQYALLVANLRKMALLLPLLKIQDNMRDVHVKLNPGLPWQLMFQREEGSFHQQIEQEETSKVLRLGHSVV